MESRNDDIAMEVDDPAPLISSSPLEIFDTSRSKIITYIEDTFTSIIDEIQNRPLGHPKIVLRRIIALKPLYDHSNMVLNWHVEDREITYSFPGKNKREAWLFACVGKILSEIYDAVKSGITVTKRDIFYRDPNLFKSQETVDRYIDDIAHTCQVTRADLRVTASPKGLVVGLRTTTNEILEPVDLVPDSVEEIGSLDLGHIKWIVVVEKEATHKSLAVNGFHRCKTIGAGLLVTGKGYPDLATRRFLRACLDHKSFQSQPPPIFGLFDCDPDGLNILKTYRYGSKAMAQEHSHNIPEMIWLGVKLSDEFSHMVDDKVFLPLTIRDRAKAQSMLTSSEWEGVPGEYVWGRYGCREALQQMLMLNRKMEIQILEDRVGGTGKWLEEKLEQMLKEARRDTARSSYRFR